MRGKEEIQERLNHLLLTYYHSDKAEEGSIRLHVRCRELLWVLFPDLSSEDILEVFNDRVSQLARVASGRG
jgi:hypothetical protein